ncbi:MAG: fatty acid desaturase [bacterium]|nr:fatty acid desaturase [bacterium]
MYQLLLTIVVALIVTQMATFSTTIYLHRAMAHHALALRPTVIRIFRLILWITTGQKTREWVAVHRKHHSFTDQDGDPHSPLLEGFWSIQFGNVFYYLKALKDENILTKYASDIEDDIWDRWLFNYGRLGISIGIILLIVILGVGWGLLAAGIHAFMYVFVLSSSINGLCHYRGYKNFDNTATNIGVVAWLTGGEGLHNNHHAFPSSPKFSWKQHGEIDPAWPIIEVLVTLGFAWRLRKTIDELMA